MRFLLMLSLMISTGWIARAQSPVVDGTKLAGDTAGQTAAGVGDSSSTDLQKRFYTRVGLSMITLYDYSKKDIWFVPGLMLCPGLRLAESKSTLLTVSLPITLGWYRSAYVGADLPIMMDVSLGSAAGNNRNARWGMFMGGGMALTYSSSVYNDIHMWGYRTHLGLTAGKGDGSGRGAVVFSYGRSTTGSDAVVWGIGFHFIPPNY